MSNFLNNIYGGFAEPHFKPLTLVPGTVAPTVLYNEYTTTTTDFTKLRIPILPTPDSRYRYLWRSTEEPIENMSKGNFFDKLLTVSL